MKRLVVYDCEIVKAIPSRDHTEEYPEGIEFCSGWRDFDNMGVSVIGVYDVDRGEPHVFLEDNFREFRNIAEDPEVIMCGFNNKQFDDKLVATLDIHILPTKSWDLLREIWVASGLNPETFVPSTHGGFGLDAVAQHNLHQGKTGTGAFAPVLWQQGKHGEVINYCLRDVMLTYRIALLAIRGMLRCPKTNKLLNIGGFPTEWRATHGQA